jgi:IS30 family transposase
MGRLNEEARMTIKVLNERGATGAEIALLLGVSEGAVRYHVRRMEAGAVDGLSAQPLKAAAYAEAIEHWRQSTEGSGLNLAALHAWLVREHGYDGSLRSVQR